MSSSYYEDLINRYKSVVQQISGLYGYLSSTESTVSSCKNSMKDNKIAGEAMDQGKLDDVSSAIESLRNAFNTIIAECQTKISENTIKYQEALAAEQLKQKKKLDTAELKA